MLSLRHLRIWRAMLLSMCSSICTKQSTHVVGLGYVWRLVRQEGIIVWSQENPRRGSKKLLLWQAEVTLQEHPVFKGASINSTPNSGRDVLADLETT